MSVAVSDFLTAALSEIRVARAGDVVNADDMTLALFIFNELLDGLNADERALYTTQFSTFTLTPSLQPHTIGLVANTPTFNVTIARPTRILWANLIVANNIRIPFELIDDAEWLNIRAQTVTSSVPRKLFYSPDWPNGSIYLWPVENTAYTLELETEVLLASVLQTDTFNLPPGYQQALRLTLAELLAPSFGQTVSESTAIKAREARARAWAANDSIPDISTRDAGMPTSGPQRGTWSFQTGWSQ